MRTDFYTIAYPNTSQSDSSNRAVCPVSCRHRRHGWLLSHVPLQCFTCLTARRDERHMVPTQAWLIIYTAARHHVCSWQTVSAYDFLKVNSTSNSSLFKKVADAIPNPRSCITEHRPRLFKPNNSNRLLPDIPRIWVSRVHVREVFLGKSPER